MKIFFSVGEPSGDLHGANLIHELRARIPDVEAVGYGGPRMAVAGCELHQDLTKLAVMWFLRVLLNLHHFFALLRRADHYFQSERPDAVVLIDYPGFNWWIARRAKRHRIPVIYYGTPQLWGWASWRVKKMQRFVDHVLCKLPFEVDWYAKRGCQATYLGHPYFDQLASEQLDVEFIKQQVANGPLVAILPGSRGQEVKSNLHRLLKAAKLVENDVPNVRFAVAAFKPAHAAKAQELVKSMSLPAEVHVGKTGEIIEAADCALAVSGSVSLELLYHNTPTVILYHISRAAYFVQRFFRKVRYITLVNLLTDPKLFTDEKLGVYEQGNPRDAHVLMPEYLTCEDRSQEIAGHVVGWLRNRETLDARVAQLAKLQEDVGAGGASARAADYIVEVLHSGTKPQLKTHHDFSADRVDSHSSAA